MIKNKNDKNLGLLNFEGDVLKAYYKPTSDKFFIFDDHGNFIESLSKKKLQKFFKGEIELTTSYNKTFNYANEHENAKPRQEQIDEFLALIPDKPKKENGLDEQYINLLKDILENGVEKETRNGKVISVFGRTIRFKFNGNNFPLLTTKKMPFKTIVTELLWFLRGDTNIKYLVDNNCHIWDGDAYKNYLIEDAKILPNMSKEKMTELGYRLTQQEFINKIKENDKFAKKWGELGPVYGKQWRSWNTNAISRRSSGTINEDGIVENMTFIEDLPIQVDQIQNLINDLKTNPDSRRLMVNAWAVHDLPKMVLPPCHYGFQVYTRELSEKERWKWLRDKFWGKGQILWDRMAFPSHEWMDKAGVVYGLEQPIDFGKVVEINVPRRAISLMWNQRSVDTFLGLPFNIASYGLLLEIIAKEVNMVPDELIGNLGDVHLYSNHIEQAKEQIGRDLSYSERWNILLERNGSPLGLDHDRIEQEVNTSTPARSREPFPLPTLNIKLHFDNEPSFVPEQWLVEDFEIKDYQFHPIIKAPLSN